MFLSEKPESLFDDYITSLRKIIGNQSDPKFSTSMNRRLIEASQKGDVQTLHNLMKNDPLLLSIVALAEEDTPLHISCIEGHVDFVKEMLNLRPEFAKELNQDGFSPLHIASAKGNIEIVKELLKVGSHLCLVKGKEMRIPLHYAVVKGRKQVIQELLSASLDSITEVTARGENCCHLALKNNQFESFKFLADHAVLHNKGEIFKMKDERGNSILHLAASQKQYEVFDLLLDNKFALKNTLEVNSLNKRGLTPLDVLISEGGDFDIEEMLRQSGASKVEELMNFSPQQAPSSSPNLEASTRETEQQRERSKRPSKKLHDYFKYDKIKDSPTEVRNILLLIAVLIATATYQPVLNPPGGIWQDNYWPSPNSSTKPQPPHVAGKAILGTHSPVAYGLFLLFNSVGFFMSLHMLNYLTIGLPLQFELRVSLVALLATYDTCMFAITPNGTSSVLFTILSSMIPSIMPALTTVVRDYKLLIRQCRRASS